MLINKFANIAMLYEKWCRTTNKRREIKTLLLGKNEK